MLLVLVAIPLAKAHCSMKEGERNRKLGDKRGPNPGIQVGPESSGNLFFQPPFSSLLLAVKAQGEISCIVFSSSNRTIYQDPL